MKQGRFLGVFAVLALALAGCADQPKRDARARALPPPQAIFHVGFAETADGAAAGPVIEVFARDVLPLTLAELVGPNGAISQARAIERQVQAPAGGSLRPEIGVGVAGGSSSGIRSSGVIISLPITGIGGPPREPSFVESRTMLAVPDPAAYRADWQNYSVRLRLGAPPGDTKHITLDAPSPQPRRAPQQ